MVVCAGEGIRVGLSREMSTSPQPTLYSAVVLVPVVLLKLRSTNIFISEHVNLFKYDAATPLYGSIWFRGKGADEDTSDNGRRAPDTSNAGLNVNC